MRKTVLLVLLSLNLMLFAQQDPDTLLISKIEVFSETGELLSRLQYEYDQLDRCTAETYSYDGNITLSMKRYDTSGVIICKLFYENGILTDSTVYKYEGQNLVKMEETIFPTRQKVMTRYEKIADVNYIYKTTIVDKTPANYLPSSDERAEKAVFIEEHRTLEIVKRDDQNRPIGIYYFYNGSNSRMHQIGEEPYLDSLQLRKVYSYDDNLHATIMKQYAYDDTIPFEVSYTVFDTLGRPTGNSMYTPESDTAFFSSSWEYGQNANGSFYIKQWDSFGGFTIDILDEGNRIIESSSLQNNGVPISTTHYFYNDLGYLIEEVYEYYYDQAPINNQTNFQTATRTVYTYQ